MLFTLTLVITAASPSKLSAKKSLPPQILIFIDNKPTPFNWSDPLPIPIGYESMTWKVSSTDSIVNWVPQVSFDNGNTWLEQHRFRCNGSNCDEVTIPVISPLYRFSLGTSNGIINVTATLNDEPEAKVIILGVGNLPIQSKAFNSKKYSSATITLGATAVSQSISSYLLLSKNKGNTYTEQQKVSCDGGAECPLLTLPLTSQKYIFSAQGSGIGVAAALLRK